MAETRNCQNCRSEFSLRPDDLLFYEKIKVPPPTFCPDCRAMRRLTFWKKRDLFRKKEIREGKEIFSSFPEASPLKIYDLSARKTKPLIRGKVFLSGCRAWIRTKITCSRGMCPTIRRPGNKNKYAILGAFIINLNFSIRPLYLQIAPNGD